MPALKKLSVVAGAVKLGLGRTGRKSAAPAFSADRFDKRLVDTASLADGGALLP